MTNTFPNTFPHIGSQASLTSISSASAPIPTPTTLLARELSGISMRRLTTGISVMNSAVSAPVLSRFEDFNDRLYTVIVGAMRALFNVNCLDTLCTPLLTAFEALLDEHQATPSTSRLRKLVPEVGVFFTKLPFVEAFRIYDQKYQITRRRFIPPTPHEIRHVMNIAQVLAVKNKLALVSFDGDQTLYPDGRNFDSTDTAQYISILLRKGISVAIVTAAGYGYQVEKYEERLGLLLEFFANKKLSPELLAKFFVFGGESNYLFRCGSSYHLEPVPEDEWRPHVSARMQQFFQAGEGSGLESEVSRLLKVAAETIEKTIEELNLRAVIIQKKRAVGLVPGGAIGKRRTPIGSGMTNLKPEILEEAVFRIRESVRSLDPPLSLPYCAFNGGHDVWVDVGNKAEALTILQSFLGISPEECLHIGDQFSVSGNDTAARDVSPTLWVCNPCETRAVLRSLLRQTCSSKVAPIDYLCDVDDDSTDDLKLDTGDEI